MMTFRLSWKISHEHFDGIDERFFKRNARMIHCYNKMSGGRCFSAYYAQPASQDGRVLPLHFQGRIDQYIPPVLAVQLAAYQFHAYFKIYPELAPHCGWQEKWTEALQLLHRLPKSAPAE